MPVPVIEGWEAANSGGATVQSITLTKPSGVQVGDLLLLIVGSDNSNTGDWQDISGWNKIVNYNASSSDAALGIYWRIADGSEGATVAPSQPAGNLDEMFGWYIRISGVDQTTPIHVLGTPAYSTSKPFTINQVTTTVDDCLVFYAVAHDGGDAGAFTPTGTSWSEVDEEYSGTGSTDACGTWGIKPMIGTQGGTGSISMTYTGTADGSSYVQFAVAPSTGEPPGPTPNAFNALEYDAEPPSAGWNKLKYASEPPVPSSWNKLKYKP